jgi:Ca2+-binding EF-hand superfamily protein
MDSENGIIRRRSSRITDFFIKRFPSWNNANSRRQSNRTSEIDNSINTSNSQIGGADLDVSAAAASATVLSDRLEDEDSSFLGGISDIRRNSMNILAARNAAAVALGSTNSMITSLRSSDIVKYVSLATQAREFEQHILISEQSFLDKVVLEMDSFEKVGLIYDLLDTDGNGVDAEDVYQIFEQIQGLKAIESILSAVKIAMEELALDYDEENDIPGLLTEQDFSMLLDLICEISKSKISDLVQIIICNRIFQNGRAIIENMLSNLDCMVDSSEEFDKHVLQARMLIVYHALDYNQSGRVQFADFVKHVSRFTTHSLNPTERNILLMVEQEDERQLKFGEFTEVVGNILSAATYPMHFHELANAMSMSICRQDVTNDDIQDLFLKLDQFEDALTQRIESPKDLKELLSFGKLNRLFDLLDLSKDGYLDFSEVALFIRRSQNKNVAIETTVQETLDSILAVDQNQDKKLDRRDFADLIMRLAHAKGADIHRLVDYLVIQNIMREDVAEDKEYINTYLEQMKKALSIPKGKPLRSKVKTIMWSRKVEVPVESSSS